MRSTKDIRWGSAQLQHNFQARKEQAEILIEMHIRVSTKSESLERNVSKTRRGNLLHQEKANFKRVKGKRERSIPVDWRP
jgi:tmRNA-binding protein